MNLESALCANCGIDDCTPIAVGTDFEYATSDEEFLAVTCRRCSLVYLNPRPDNTSLAATYPDNYHAFDFAPKSFGLIYRVRERLEAQRLLKWCRGLRQDARILDIGCGDGFHVDLLRRFGQSTWQVEGIDSDERAVAGAKRRGVEIRCGRIEDADLQTSSYDLVLMIMTLEHLSDPLHYVRRAYELLRPSGRLVIVTDNTGSPDFWLFGNRHWGGYHFPRHEYLFNKKNLAELCERAGFKTLSVKTALSPVNWTYSFRNWIQDWRGPKWLHGFLSLKSPVALAFFTLLDLPLSWIGYGAILHGSFQRPNHTVSQ